eukprot:1105408_1
MAQQSFTEQMRNLKLPAQGSIRWKVTGDELKRFKHAKHKQRFYSQEFETIDGTKWRIKFYPHGKATTEDCSIYLECVTLCANKERIGVNWSFNIAEVDWVDDFGTTFKSDGETRGRFKAFKAERINNLYA